VVGWSNNRAALNTVIPALSPGLNEGRGRRRRQALRETRSKRERGGGRERERERGARRGQEGRQESEALRGEKGAEGVRMVARGSCAAVRASTGKTGWEG